MQQKIGRKLSHCLLLAFALGIAGCDETEELAELAKEANRQQAQQNQGIAKVNRK